MSQSNNTISTERTSLLTKLAPEPIDEAQDEEAGNRTANRVGDDNPLYEGNIDVAKTMWLLFPAVSIGVLLSAADQTLVVTTYGKIGSDLKALNNTSWIATAYFLTLTSFQPLYGKLSDIFGRKPALLFAYTVFGLGCLFCGLARNLTELALARAFAGIGGGGMTTVVSILFSDIIPLRNRGSWQGYINLVWATGASAGAPLGGLLADSVGWRWSFLGQAPLCFLAIIVVYFGLDLPKGENSDWKSKLGKIDFLGAFSLVAAVSALLLGLDRGSNVAWSDKITIVCCAIAIPLFLVFMIIEMKVATNPFAPGRIILNRSLLSSYMVNFFGLAGQMSTIFYVPLYLQVVSHLSTTDSGLRLIPAMAFSVIGSLFSGRVMQWTGKYYWLTIACICVSLMGVTVVLVSGGLLDSSWGLIGGLCFMSFGLGSVITTTLIHVIANAEPADQAIATACTYLFRSLGSVVGVSLGSTAVQQSLRTLLTARLGSGREAEGIVEGVRRSLDFIQRLDPETRGLVTLCYQKASTTAFGLSSAFVSFMLLSSFFMKEKKLSR